MHVRTFQTPRRLEYQALEGYLMSSSCAPEPGHPNQAPMLAELRTIFDAHNVNGTVTFDSETAVYLGQLQPPG